MLKCNHIPKELEIGFDAVNKLIDGGGVTVRFERADHLTLTPCQDEVIIGYSAIAEALRGMSMARRVWETGNAISQTKKYDTLTVMVDCSRNSVLKPESVKELMATVAMLGFNAMMLYTEDTYELPGNPYFGHMRGRYSMDELKMLNAYGNSIGIELIPCIQTLAHLNGIFNWPVYSDIRDLDDILIAEDEKSLALIDTMLSTCRECFSSNRIHVGMDEAHNLGRGQYLNRNGYSPKPDIMLRHLDKVKKLCDKYNYTPIMWSDMFFRMQFNGTYMVSQGELSQEVLDKIPENVSMCYWNYYSPPAHRNILKNMSLQHQRMNREIWFAGGSWCWTGPVPKNYFSNFVTPNQLAYADDAGIKNVIATIWGDDGGECSVWDVLPSLLQYGELNYTDAWEENIEARSLECFGLSYQDMLKLDAVSVPEEFAENTHHPECTEKSALFNDPLLGIMNPIMGKHLAERYRRAAEALRQVPDSRFDYLFKTQFMLAKFLEVKALLPVKIKEAYQAGDKEALQQIICSDIPVAIQRLDNYIDALREQWLRINKPFGFEIQDIRLGGLRQRLFTASLRLSDYLSGKISNLEELEQPDLPYATEDNQSLWLNSWRKAATASVISHN